ncbi:hypothetical protein MYCTH_2135245 [Thermothelomyces thermophilus ATCC 42464]|uniref:Uncharacterized protein n=1 Tax=Thermothelomyces thermophilus (strain ATCC 42464 / BCRC 31852 / DSM 1799) TaxID=573729 RepID=G2QKG3_THET4|nr:uncharacterized protein MYCTH_2135245 [Thermothelomyces thermophilus ATCC 42464]AEO60069.1 hypothetical protein MYCTH_2135245 [Thermothelomyces thermophilus ATCC 42464]
MLLGIGLHHRLPSVSLPPQNGNGEGEYDGGGSGGGGGGGGGGGCFGLVDMPIPNPSSLPAGPNDVLATGFDTAHVQVTTGSGLHDRTVAEHTLGLLLKRDLALLRNARLPGAAKHLVYIE